MLDIDTLISTIKVMKGRGAFRKYIEFIHFPFFRNIERGTRIIFDFPLTVFVGQNGLGKSSTLHALYGAPNRQTPYEFWFSTVVDPIKNGLTEDERHGFFYMYKDEHGNEKEVAKVRIFKRNNPDYWETSRPLVRYGMRILPEGQRNDPLRKPVTYIDFRAELSAFDKYFYFKKPKKGAASKTKQEYIRKKSKSLKKLVDGTAGIIGVSKPQNKPVENLSPEELKYISYILGKEYTAGKVIVHKLFADWGTSVIFTTRHFTYSEAFAGSGEMAAVRLVQEVLKAERFSLILLDEPEVSLHPGAQKRLKQFLLDQIRIKQLQIVISTHSPNIIEGLPVEAIKVFDQIPTGKFVVKANILPEEAFYHLEQTASTKKEIIVEDLLSREIIRGVLKEMGPATESLFKVDFYTGGATILKNHYISVFSQTADSRKFIMFDGDQKPPTGHFNPDSILNVEQTNQRFKDEIRRQTGGDVEFFPDGNSDDGMRTDQEKDLQKKYLKYYLRNIYYFPLPTAEEIIWNNDLASKFLSDFGNLEQQQLINASADFKNKFLIMAEVMTGDKKNIVSIENIFLKSWLNMKNDAYNQLVAKIEHIKSLR